jgi:hypothetical protein
MQKTELVHLHGLLVEITQSLVDQGVVPAEVRNEYAALDITAHSIHAQKRDHREAVLVLATALSTALAQPTENQSSISVPDQ